jgi:hypothetical protein
MNSSVKHVCFVKWNAFSRVFKQGLALKKVYPDIKLTLICDTILHSPDVFEKTFDELVHISGLTTWMKQNDPDIYHCADDGQLWIPKKVRGRTATPVVYDANDFTGMYGKGISEDEKWLLENVAGIATKFPKWALDWYIEQGVNVKAPYLEYFDYCCPEFFQTEDPAIFPPSIVHGGATSGKKGDNNYHGDWLPEILQHGFVFTVYTSPWDDVPSGYEHLNKFPLFSIKKGLHQPEIQQKMAGYDYGANLHDFRWCGKPDIFERTAYSHKLSTYMEAGLPIIVSDNLTWIKEVIVDRLGCGYTVTFDDDLASFKERFESADEQALRDKVLEVRDNEYNAYKQVGRLVEFYEHLR